MTIHFLVKKIPAIFNGQGLRFKMEPITCPQTSVTQEHRSHLHRDGSLKLLIATCFGSSRKPSSRVKQSKKNYTWTPLASNMELKCPETPVRNHHSTLRKIPNVRRTHGAISYTAECFDCPSFSAY